jgi:dTDP-glucose pyrophosphorylase
MGEITRTTPKPLIPVAGIPALTRVITAAASQGFREFVVVTGYLGNLVRERLGDGHQFGVTINYVHQEHQTGTGSALLLTREAVGDSDLLLCFADILTSPENYGAMRNRFDQEQCDITAALRRVDDPWRAAAVYVDGQMNIERIIEKPPIGSSTTPWAHAGMYCFRSEIYGYVENIQPSPRGEYEVVDAVAQMIAEGKRVRGMELTGYWKDLATPEDVREAEVLVR